VTCWTRLLANPPRFHGSLTEPMPVAAPRSIAISAPLPDLHGEAATVANAVATLARSAAGECIEDSETRPPCPAADHEPAASSHGASAWLQS
jgi:hypothetical protein